MALWYTELVYIYRRINVDESEEDLVQDRLKTTIVLLHATLPSGNISTVLLIMNTTAYANVVR